MFGLVLAAMVGASVLQQGPIDAPVYTNEAFGVSIPRPFDDWVFEPGIGPQTTTVIFHPRGRPLSDQLWGALVLTTFGGRIDVVHVADQRVRGTWRRLLGRDFALLARDTLTLTGWPAVHLGMAGTISGTAVEVDEYVIARDSDLVLLQLRAPDDLPQDSIASGYDRVIAGLRIRARSGGAAEGSGPPPAVAARGAGAREMPRSPWRASAYDALVQYGSVGPSLAFAVRAELANDGPTTADSLAVWLSPALQWDSARASGRSLTLSSLRDVAWLVLPRGVAPGDRTSVTFFYHGSGGGGGEASAPVVITDRGAVAADDWLPRPQPAFDSTGQLLAGPHAPVALSFDLPEDWRAVAPGRLTSEAVWHGRRRMTWQQGDVADAIPAFAIGPYQVAAGVRGGIPVAIWSTADDSLTGAAIDSLAGAVAGAWRFCGRAFGRLPISEVELATAPLPAPRGFPGLILLDRATAQAFDPADSATAAELDRAINALAQEVARTWWGNSVAAVGPGSGWIVESFPAWAAVAAQGVLEGDSVRQRLVREALAQWHALDTAGDLPLSAAPPFGSDETLLDSKGVAAIEAARRAMGEARFREAVFALALDHRNAAITLDEVLSVFGADGAAALRPFLF